MERQQPRDIAIIGLACLFPGARDAGEFWRNVVEKRDAITDPPGSWEMDVLYEAGSTSNDRVYCRRGGYLRDVAFDPLANGVLPRAVGGGEADQWLALQVARQALDDAGYPKDVPERERTGVVLGKGSYINRGNASLLQHGLVLEELLDLLRRLEPARTEAELEALRAGLKRSLPPFDADTVSSLSPNITASRIANRLNLMGPTYTVDAACASSLVAVDLASQYLAAGQCDLVLAGGVHVVIPGPFRQVFCQLGALSPREEIRPFDDEADGTVPGDGVGMVVLKRLRDARRDGNRVYAVIKGVGVSSDGRGLSVMAPRVEGQVLALRRAYEAAGISPRTVGLIEAHGTGTPLGDPTEIAALAEVFGERGRELPWCAVGSVKSMLGHLMPAAGVAGLIKAALALHHGVLPPTLKVRRPIAALRDERSAFYVNTQTRPWLSGGTEHPRRAGVNAFGFGGINAHVILEEAREPLGRVPVTPGERDAELCVLGASSRAGLLEAISELASGLTGDRSLRQVAEESCRSSRGDVRLAVVAGSVADLKENLERAAARLSDPKCRNLRDQRGIYFFEDGAAKAGKLAFLFPGEGSQYPDLLKDLCLQLPAVREWFELTQALHAAPSAGILPGEFLFPSPLWSDAERALAKKRLWSFEGAVAAVLTADSALLSLLRRAGLSPDAVLGHSTGELVALTASGVVDVDSGERAAERFAADLIDASRRLRANGSESPALLASVGTDASTVARVVERAGGAVRIAMENCSLQTVISGDAAAVEAVIADLQGKGVLCERLDFDRPYHTPGFRPFLGPIREVLERWIQAPASVPVYSCATGSVFPADLAGIRELAVEQWAAPVAFRQTIEAMYRDGFRTFVEVGARGNLTSFVDDILRGRPHLTVPMNLERRSGVAQLCHALGLLCAAGYALDLDVLYGEAVAVATPAGTSPGAVPLALDFPRLDLSPEEMAALRRSPDRIAPLPAPLAQPGLSELSLAGPIGTMPGAYAPAAVMSAHLRTMEQFLDVEREIMEAFLSAGAREAAPPPELPLVSEIVTREPGRRAEVLSRIDIAEHLYLRDHTFGRHLSRVDPDLLGVPVVPLAFSAELMAETASLIHPGKVLVGMREVRGYQWIVPEEGPLDLRVAARAVEGSGSSEAFVEVLLEAAPGPPASRAPIAQGVMVFADTYPAPPASREEPLEAARPYPWPPDRLYEDVMFHGPAFRGVKEIGAIGRDGLTARVEALPRGSLLRSDPDPRFLLDPVLLDAMVQLLGFWFHEQDRDSTIFPYRLGSVALHGPPCPPGAELSCGMRVTRREGDTLATNCELRRGGEVLIRVTDLEERRFPTSSRLNKLCLDPGRTMLTDAWPVAGLPEACTVRLFGHDSVGPGVFTGGGIWVKALVACTLSRGERELWTRGDAADAGRLDWLAERIAAKDAVRDHVRRTTGLAIPPCDIEIRADGRGQPAVVVHGAPEGFEAPALSVCHSGPWAAAVVAGAGASLGIDIEVVSRAGDPRPGQASRVLTHREREPVVAVCHEAAGGTAKGERHEAQP